MRRALILLVVGVVILAWFSTDSDRSPTAQAQNNSLRERVRDVRQEMNSLFEEVEDLAEPVNEFEIFDQCMYLLGATEYGNRSDNSGYIFREGGRRPALALDIRSFDPPQYQLMANPGEEPPSIECNEDAEGRPEND